MEKISVPLKFAKRTNSFYSEKNNFWKNELMKLPERWQKIIQENGKVNVKNNNFKHSFIFT